MEKLKLSETSALVLLFLGDAIYTDPMAQQYLSNLDLSEGETLYAPCYRVWEHMDQVFKNRKFGVLHLSERVIDSDIEQIIVAAAGLDAMGLELAGRYPHVQIFELDRDNMDKKAALVEAMGGVSNIHFVAADIADIEGVCGQLARAGWESTRPSLLILEGITYYVPQNTMCALVGALAPVWVIAEFLCPAADLTSVERRIADGVFSTITDLCGLPPAIHYDFATMGDMLNRRLVDEWSMYRLEATRLEGAAPEVMRHFSSQMPGWIAMGLYQQ